MPACYFNSDDYPCDDNLDEDSLCSGCGKHVCDRHPGDPWGNHDPEDHLDNPDEGDDEGDEGW